MYKLSVLDESLWNCAVELVSSSARDVGAAAGPTTCNIEFAVSVPIPKLPALLTF